MVHGCHGVPFVYDVSRLSNSANAAGLYRQDPGKVIQGAHPGLLWLVSHKNVGDVSKGESVYLCQLYYLHDDLVRAGVKTLQAHRPCLHLGMPPEKKLLCFCHITSWHNLHLPRY